MSAVFGIYYRDGQPVDGELTLMIRTLAHRGMVERGWQEGNVALGVREGASGIGKLLVTDDLVFAGELRLDDPEGLRCNLDAPKEWTDVELALMAYRKWGENCPVRILGDFAFAIWDRTRKHLFCARDCFGVRPFYYHLSPHLFAFASDTPAILALPGVDRRVNETRIGDWLASLRQDKESTFFQEIRRLPPATSLSLDVDAPVLTRYWNPFDRVEPLNLSEGEFISEYRVRLESAVRARLTNTSGSLLSGGLDSSSIVCLGTNILNSSPANPFPTFSAIYDQTPDCDESQYVDAVAAQKAIVSHRYHPERHSLFVASIDPEPGSEPYWFAQANVHYLGFQLANQCGVPVILDGFAGDIVTSHGLAHFTELVNQGRLQTFIREARAYRPNYRPIELLRLFADYGLRANVPGPLADLWRRAKAKRQSNTLVSLLCPEFVAEIGLANRATEQSRIPAVARRTVLRSGQWSIDHGENVLSLENTDRLAARFGIEPRFPFLDRRLVEFCLRVPGRLKLQDGYTRWIARQALRSDLPKEVLARKGKATPVTSFCKQLPTRELGHVKEELERVRNDLKHYVEYSQVLFVLDRLCRQPNWTDAYFVWRCVVLGNWLTRI